MIGSGKEKGGTSAKGEQSWRELAGPRRRRINSPQAKKRRHKKFLRALVLLSLFVIFMAAAAWSIVSLNQREESITITPPSKPIERILFETNGVLPNKWISSVVQLKPGMLMMEADIHLLKAEIEKEGQVKSASVERVFPSALRIVVEEHIPSMLLATSGADGRRSVRIVSQTGTIYKGIGYPRSTYDNLPFLSPYQHADGSYLPFKGIERVAELLDYSRQNNAQLFKTWELVSLRHYSGDLDLPGQVIEVRSSLVPRIIFSASSDLGQQLDRLNYILQYVQRRGNPSIERIDLSLQGSAAVQFSSGRIATF